MNENIFKTINDYRKRRGPTDIEGLAQALGVRVRYSDLGKDISGMIEKENEKDYVITVNSQDSPERQRFTIAHELGHFVYHRNKLGNGVDDNRAFRSTESGKYHNMEIGPNEEMEANRFAAATLMPPDKIKSFLREGMSDVSHLASILQVSKQAMGIAIERVTKKMAS